MNLPMSSPRQPPQNQYGQQQQQQQFTTSSHSRRRTSSSGVFPAVAYDLYYGANSPQHPNYPGAMSSQKPRTSSTSTDGGSRASSTDLRRSVSTNTTASAAPPMSNYVARLRRQKATVWCDRSQPEDQRLLAAQKAAKLKAALELNNGPSSSRGMKGGGHGLGSGASSTTSFTHKLGKASHHADMGVGSLVKRPPPRLSATEANDDSGDEDDLDMADARGRSGSGSASGRSSLNSNHRSANNRASTMYPGEYRNSSYSDVVRKNSRGSSRGSPNISSTELSESQRKFKPTYILEETSPDVRLASSYFQQSPPMDKAALRRSGSVDEREARTMTMSGLRLVVANPD